MKLAGSEDKIDDVIRMLIDSYFEYKKLKKNGV